MQHFHSTRCAAMILVLLALAAPIAAKQKDADKTVSKVVKLLQDMLEVSKKDGDEERVIYAKFKCYCDTAEAAKKEEIEALTKDISVLESKIEEIQGSSGYASTDSFELKQKIAENRQAVAEAKHIREKQKKAFEAEKEDLEQAIGQLRDAIETLSAVGADQTKSEGADYKQFMDGNQKAGFVQLRDSVNAALSVAQALMNENQYKSVTSFIQAPFTGTYTSQSAEVLGIMKNMRDTFEGNLLAAEKEEKEAVEAHKEFIELKDKELEHLVEMLRKAQGALASNDSELSAKRKQLAMAEKQKAEDEEFLAKLIPMCKVKAKEYEERKLMRTNEEAAIAEAISILNSDSAFKTFSETSLTPEGSTMAPGDTAFFQLASVSRHVPEADVRIVMQRLLRRAAAEAGHKTPRLGHVMSLLHEENPFDTVLEEIDKMIDLINKESAQDKENLLWCAKEQKENREELKTKYAEILKLQGEIEKLDKAINEPETGLKAQIETTEQSLKENNEAQKTETEDRRETNMAYQKDIKTLVAGQEILTNAIKVLKGYYDKIEKSFMQEDPAPPPTWKGPYEGQSKGGNDAISMLEFILDDMKKEENFAHTNEEEAQANYEDSMTSLKKEQAEKEKNLVELQKTLADTENDLLMAEDDLKATIKDAKAIEAYLDRIRPGCTFIQENYVLRTKSRVIEKDALEHARKLLKDSPAYKNAEKEAHVESFGHCKKPCVTDEEDVTCKACMADVTIPGFCAGHPNTKGCGDEPAMAPSPFYGGEPFS